MIHTINITDVHAIAILDLIEFGQQGEGDEVLSLAEKDLRFIAESILEVERENAANRLLNGDSPDEEPEDPWVVRNDG